MALERLTTIVPWMKNPRGEAEVASPVISFLGGVIIFPSASGQNSPTDQSHTRLDQPQAGALERCELFPTPSENAYIAYPLEEFGILPGVHSPARIIWERNEVDPKLVMSTIFVGDCKFYIRIFPNEASVERSPQPERSYHLEGLVDGSETDCWISYILKRPNQVFGHAFGALKDDDEPKPTTKGIHVIGTTGLVLVDSLNIHKINTSEKDGKITIVIEPIK